jgi:hypothetical protein
MDLSSVMSVILISAKMNLLLRPENIAGSHNSQLVCRQSGYYGPFHKADTIRIPPLSAIDFACLPTVAFPRFS